MAPALQNVGGLVRIPTGCGEQNMVGLVPNIYLLQYLDSTDQSEPELEEKAKEYMRIGYRRQRNYNHPNGAYSIWGDKGDKDRWRMDASRKEDTYTRPISREGDPIAL